MAPPEVESWRVPAPSRPCAFCRQDVGTDPSTSCPRCEAAYHPDCWVSNSRRCAVYGCEPAPKPPRPVQPVRPVLQPPELPRTGTNWAWFTPILIIIGMNVARVGLNNSSSRPAAPPPFPPQILRQVGQSNLELLMDFSEPVIPALPDDVPALIEEAQALEDSATALQSLPRGRLTGDVKALLRETVVADLVTLQMSLKLYRRCAATQPDEEIRGRIERLRETIGRRRSLLLDLMRAREPD